jgi:hypothetical protein
MTLMVGATVKLVRNAKVYKKHYGFDNWVYDAEFQLRELKGDRAVIYYGDQCTGACYASDLIVIGPVHPIG